MFTNSDFARMAQAKGKKAAAVKEVANNTVEKVKSIAEAAKEAVASAFPATTKALDERTEQLLVLHAGLEQRVESLETTTGVQTVVNAEKAAERAGGLMAQLKARKAKEEKKEEAPAATTTKTKGSKSKAGTAPKGEKAATTTGTTRKLRLNDVPKN